MLLLMVGGGVPWTRADATVISYELILGDVEFTNYPEGMQAGIRWALGQASTIHCLEHVARASLRYGYERVVSPGSCREASADETTMVWR